MINEELLEKVKAVSLPIILAENGIFPDNGSDPYSGKRQYPYLAEYRGETHPSLSVYCSTKGNWLFKDHATGETGTNIDLLVKFGIYSDWREAVLGIAAKYFGEGAEGSKRSLILAPSKAVMSAEEKQWQGKILSVEPLSGSPVENYVVYTRQIPLSLAMWYLSYVRYTYHDEDGKNYYGIGWRTVKGSWSIRWPINNPKKGKCFIGPAGISFFSAAGDEKTSECDVFEGIFDFLAYLTLGTGGQRKDAFILNSVDNLKEAIPELAPYEVINCYFDRDDAGCAAMKKMKKAYPCSAYDRSEIYWGYKDLNDWLCYLSAHGYQWHQ